VIVPYTELAGDTLRAVIEAFVLREGTDYGARAFDLEEKVAHVRSQLERGIAQILYDPDSETIDIVPANPSPRRT
jgi:uncharacterized protein